MFDAVWTLYVFQREIEMTRRQTAKEKMSERDEQLKDSGQQDREHEEEKQKELPHIYIPDPPSPLCCGFYSEPGQFWLSMVRTHKIFYLTYIQH